MFVPTNFQITGCIVPENPLFSLFPIEKPNLTNLILPKIGQDHSRVIIRTNYNGQKSQMLHDKFRCNRLVGSGEAF